jgi:nitrite reductase (NADH) small subunit
MSSTRGALRLTPSNDTPSNDTPGNDEGADAPAGWTDVCALEDIIPDTGVCALLGERQVAIVRVGWGDEVHALDNFDPVAKAFVLSRGIVGDSGGVVKIASPITKRAFDLRTGRCLDDATVSVPVFDVRVREGRVQVRGTPRAAPSWSAAPLGQ